ncbi:MAG TPA: acyl-ACP desaturase [Pyrinomonadaceae bacterium]|nr:acyl-ACP desaturase [Pyrinomonadaceae bacterium]
MPFETKNDVLAWYEGQERTLTPEFVDSIPWGDVSRYELDPRFLPVLLYMRDVESLTDMYHREMARTPTGRDPVISKFMERWATEEITHAEVLDRFLNEAGYPTDAKWSGQVHRAVSYGYRINNSLIGWLANAIGRSFTATHMTFGAVHEMSTGQGYRRLITLANHPVLTYILEAIIREESAHTQFYRSVAKIELRDNPFARRMTRWIIDNYWKPVGQGSVPKKRTDMMVQTLFGSDEGIEAFHNAVTRRVSQLPGFDGLTRMSDTLRKIVSPEIA